MTFDTFIHWLGNAALLAASLCAIAFVYFVAVGRYNVAVIEATCAAVNLACYANARRLQR